MIRIQINVLLKERKRSFYWLAKETGVSHTTLWRLKKDKAQGITFNTLEKICQTLKCQPGDVLRVGRERENHKKRK
jgi:putative transcriptional regulator